MPWVFVLIVIVVAALVAAAGDRMGHRAARRKLRIGKLRPRTVSTIIAVTTGVLISLATFGIVFAVWKDFRQALLHYDEVKHDKEQAEKDLLNAKAELTDVQGKLGSAKAEIEEQGRQLALANQQITDKETEIQGVEQQLSSKTLSLKETDALLKQKVRLVSEKEKLIAQAKALLKEVESEAEAAKINQAASKARAGDAELLIPKDSFLTYERVEAADYGRLEALVSRAYNRVKIRISNLGSGLSPDTDEQMGQFIASYPVAAGTDSVVVLRAAKNLFSGEPLSIRFEALPLKTLIPAGAVVMEITVDTNSARLEMSGQPDVNLDIPASFDSKSFVDFIVAGYYHFSAGMAALGFLPQLPSGEFATPFDALSSQAENLVTRDRPYKIQIVSKKNVSALDGLADCEIYINSIGAPKAAQDEAAADETAPAEPAGGEAGAGGTEGEQPPSGGS